MSFAMRASIRIDSSVRCISSFADGSATGSGASTGFGMAGAAGPPLMRVMSSRASCSSTSRRCAATAISPVALAFGNTGNGVFARRGRSVLPPPSRLDWARISATAGFNFDLAFTSATSSGGVRSLICAGSNGRKRIASSTA